MQIHQLRNATAVLTMADRVFLIDPMLSDKGALPGFKLFGGGRRRNPLVPLPPGMDEILARVTDVIITHEHPDHLDGPGIQWIEERALPVWASRVDVANLRRKRLDAREWRDGALGMAVEVVPARHGRGLLGWLMGPVSGLYLAHPDEPSVYLTSDALLTSAVLDAIDRLQPDIVLAPAGAANMGIGGDILFSVDELVALVRRAPGTVVFNHLEALDHCPTTRAGLRARLHAEGLLSRVRIPDDGERLTFERPASPTHEIVRRPDDRRPGFQKWLTAKFAGT